MTKVMFLILDKDVVFLISMLGQVMVYVNNQDEAVKFWVDKVGFTIISEEDNGAGMRYIEIAPQGKSQTTIVLHDKNVVAKMGAGVNLETPSLLFFTEDVETLYANLKNKGVVVGEIMPMPIGKAFNFADDEQNYFAVVERNK